MNQRTGNMDIGDIIFILKKHIKLLIIITVACGIVGFSASNWLIKPQYESDAILIVNAAQSSQTTGITYDEITAAQQLVNTCSIILKSDTVLNQVIDNLNLDTDAITLAKSITVTGVNQTQVIDIAVTDPNPQTAADIANQLISVAPDVIVNTVKAGSVEIISSAKKPENPSSPNKPLYTAISFLVGLVVSILIAFGLEMMNNTFLSGDDVQKYLEYPVLGVIPTIKNRLFQTSKSY